MYNSLIALKKNVEKSCYEIYVIANDLKIEIKSKRAHKNYPKDVIVLDENNLPLFLAVI